MEEETAEMTLPPTDEIRLSISEADLAELEARATRRERAIAAGRRPDALWPSAGPALHRLMWGDDRRN